MAFWTLVSFLSILALLPPSAIAHTWIEQMQVIGENGSYVGDYGYPRGYMARTDPGFNGFSDVWQLPSPITDIGKTRLDNQMMACHPAQRTANYSSEYPKLSVTPGAYVAMRYLENGHVSQPNIPEGKPKGSGTVYIYGTYEPSDSEKLMDVLSWSSDGNGGNRKGFLMAAQSYDDGRCYQINGGPISVNRQAIDGKNEVWCESDLLVPKNAPADKTLTVYWVWSWPTEGSGCKDEYYTTCADFDVVQGTDKLSPAAQHALIQQSPQKNAVSDYKSRTAYSPTPILITTQGCQATGQPAASSPPTGAPQLSSAYSVPGNLSISAVAPPAPSAADNAPTVITTTALATTTAPNTIIFKTITLSAAAEPSNPSSDQGMIGKYNSSVHGQIGQRSEKHVSAHGRLRHNVRKFV